ncbi:hypothetical protein Q1695_016370 [Nippostrongylus brasiliensis]|nr:hypothetical protein Q1695_016370 [Nippostrongylus brasiliensis]
MAKTSCQSANNHPSERNERSSSRYGASPDLLGLRKTEECTRGFIDTYPASENEDLAEDIKTDLGFQVDDDDEMTTFAAKHDGKHEVFVKVDKKGGADDVVTTFKAEHDGKNEVFVKVDKDGNGEDLFFFKHSYQTIDEQEFEKYEKCKFKKTEPVEDSN